MGIRIEGNMENSLKYGVYLEGNFTIRFNKTPEPAEIGYIIKAFNDVKAAKKDKERKFCSQKDCCCDRFIKVQEEAFESIKRSYGVTYFSNTAFWGA